MDIPMRLRTTCGHDSWTVDGCMHCEAADLIEGMYAALKEAEAGLEFAGADTPPVGDFVPAPLLALRAVRAAIAKAEGG